MKTQGRVLGAETRCVRKKKNERRMEGRWHPTSGQMRILLYSVDISSIKRVASSILLIQLPSRIDIIQLQKLYSMNIVCSDFNCLHMISNTLQLIALGITFSVSVKSLLPGTIKGGLGLLNPACQNSNGPFGSSVIHLSSVNSWQLCPSIDYQLQGRQRGTTGRPFVSSPEGGLQAK